MYIKIFNTNLDNYKVGETYSIKENLSINNNFVFYENLNDINSSNHVLTHSHYYIVKPKGKVLLQGKKFLTNAIKIEKELTIDDLIKLDSYGSWTFNYLFYNYELLSKKRIKYLQEKIIKKDLNGNWCYLLAKDIPYTDLHLLQHEVIKKDINGMICYDFISNIKGCNVFLLQKAIIEKDNIGQYVSYLCDIPLKGINIRLVIDNVIKKDKIGQWSFYCFVRCNKLTQLDRAKLMKHIFKIDRVGTYKKALNNVIKNELMYQSKREYDQNLDII